MLLSSSLELDAERVEPVRPEAAVARDPFVELEERLGVERVEAAAAFDPRFHETLLAEDAEVSRDGRPAVSRHLRVLREQGLVQARVEGRRRLYSLDPEPLLELDEWVTRYRGFWTNRLDALGVELKRRRKEQR